MEPGDRDGEPQLLFQVLRIAVNEVIRTLVALMDKRVVHVQRLDARFILLQPRDVRVVFPNRIGRGSHIGLELTRAGGVQITNRRRKHDDIPGLVVLVSESVTVQGRITDLLIPSFPIRTANSRQETRSPQSLRLATICGNFDDGPPFVSGRFAPFLYSVSRRAAGVSLPSAVS